MRRPRTGPQIDAGRLATGRQTDHPRPAGARQRRGRELHVPAHEGAHGRTRPARRRPGRDRGQWGRRPADDPGFRAIPRQLGKKPAHARFEHAGGGGGRHAPELDAPAGHGRPAGVPGSPARPSQGERAQARSGPLRVARPGPGFGGKQRPRGPAHRQPNRAPLGHRCGVRGGSRGRGFGSGDPPSGPPYLVRNGPPVQRTRGTGAPTATAPRRHRRLDRHRDEFRHLRADVGHAHPASRADARARHGRGPARAQLGCGAGEIRAGHRGEPHPEL